MQLSLRLYTIAQCVPRGCKVIDVGTDHAYIPIYLIKNHIASFCIATDINIGPLKKAKSNMALHHIENIELRLTNGLEGVKPKEANVVIIAGMGGHLIIDILKKDLTVTRSIDKLILQPQRDIHCVRKFLHGIGFKIQNEEFLEEDGKYYTVIVAILGEETYKKDYEYRYGKILIQKKSEIFKTYLLKKQKRLTELHDNLSQASSKYSDRRKKELEEELKMHKEVIQCIF